MKTQIVLCAVLILFGVTPTLAQKKLKAAAQTAARWHQAEGKRSIEAGDIGEAVAQWTESLRIDPKNAALRAELKRAQARLARMPKEAAPTNTPQIIPAEEAAAKIAAVKKALDQMAAAKKFIDVAEILTDETAERLGSQMLMIDLMAISYTARDPAHTLDPPLMSDFQSFIQSYGLNGALRPYGLKIGDDVSVSLRPSDLMSARTHNGRALLLALSGWTKRLHRSRIDMTVDIPREWAKIPLQKDGYTYTFYGLNWIGIDRFRSGGVPLEARFQDGKWRIGALNGKGINFNPVMHLEYGGVYHPPFS